MNKSTMGFQWRKQILFTSILLMLAGLLFSRFLLSSALFVFTAASLIHKNLTSQLKEFFASPILLSMTLLFFIPLISGLWSEDIAHWGRIMRIKLPLLLIPVCFAGIGELKLPDWRKIGWIFTGLVLIGCFWSGWHYVQDIQKIHQGYLRSQAILTPVKNDHVRFSLLVAISIITLIFLYITDRRKFRVSLKIILVVVTALLVIYLHILAVRTGLLCLYLSLFIFIGWLLWNKKSLIRSIVLLLCLIALPVVSYFILPTFKNRVKYFNYDISFVKKNIYLPGSNDGMRIISMKTGWEIQNENPLIGVGIGDVEAEMNHWYAANYPQMIQADRILPSSEWIMYGVATGWIGFILFTIALLVPFFVKQYNRNIFWWMINLSIALTYFFDNGLEGQFGVFAHAFILLWWWKMLKVSPTIKN